MKTRLELFLTAAVVVVAVVLGFMIEAAVEHLM